MSMIIYPIFTLGDKGNRFATKNKIGSIFSNQ